MNLPNKIYFVSDGCTANLQEEITDSKSKEVSGRYIYEDGYWFRDKEVLLSLTTIQKLKNNNLIKINAMQRLVTKQDLIDNPELQQKGVSVNQYYNFPDDYVPSATTTDTDHYEITEETVPYESAADKKKKSADKEATKSEAKKKPNNR